MDNFWRWLSYQLPKRLVYFAAIRLGAHATTGQYGSTVVPELTFMDAVGRYEGGS
jgi:hypothetical protein